VFKIKQQQEMTTKLILVVIGLTSVGAILVPTYAVPTIRSADIFDETIVSADLKDGAAVKSSDIVDSQVNTADLANSAVTTDKIADGAVTSNKLASGAVALTTTFRSEQESVPAGVNTDIHADCNDDEVVTGGGFGFGSVFDRDVEIFLSAPEGNSWRVFADNHHASESALVTVYAVCVTPVP
jgi:hypothetical protein